jgi:hypothetical protein
VKLVYVAGPFRAMSNYVPGHQDMFAVQENIMAAMKLGLEVARMRGAFPVIPHANTMFFTGAAPDNVWLEGDLEMLRRCDAVVFTEDYMRSSGAREEHAFAQRHHIPIFYTVAALRHWLYQPMDRPEPIPPDILADIHMRASHPAVADATGEPG